MDSIILELKLPQDVFLALQSAGLDRERLSTHATRDLAVQLYSEGRLSLGKSAKLADLPVADFWRLLTERGLPVITYDEDDLESDLKVVQRWIDAETGS